MIWSLGKSTGVCNNTPKKFAIFSSFYSSNLSERSLTRLVVGPFKLRVCSGLFHRLGSLRVAASTYDYPPYSVPKPEPLLSELLPPSEEDYDALNECIPSRTTQITVFAPIIEVQMMDHPYFEPQKGSLFRKRKVSGYLYFYSLNSPKNCIYFDIFLLLAPQLNIFSQFLETINRQSQFAKPKRTSQHNP